MAWFILNSRLEDAYILLFILYFNELLLEKNNGTFWKGLHKLLVYLNQHIKWVFAKHFICIAQPWWKHWKKILKSFGKCEKFGTKLCWEYDYHPL